MWYDHALGVDSFLLRQLVPGNEEKQDEWGEGEVMLSWTTFVGGENYFPISFYLCEGHLYVQKSFLFQQVQMLGCHSSVGKELNLVGCDQHKGKI